MNQQQISLLEPHNYRRNLLSFLLFDLDKLEWFFFCKSEIGYKSFTIFIGDTNAIYVDTFRDIFNNGIFRYINDILQILSINQIFQLSF